MVVAIVAIACATGLIKSWMKRSRSSSEVDAESFNRLAKAFMEHKKEMQRRVENLEAIVADEDEKDDFSQIEAPDRDNTLSNDLKGKERVQS